MTLLVPLCYHLLTAADAHGRAHSVNEESPINPFLVMAINVCVQEEWALKSLLQNSNEILERKI